MELVLLHGVRPHLLGHGEWLANRAFPSSPRSNQVSGDMSNWRACWRGRDWFGLGGGGVRGFAHIGVIRAIEEAGIPVDMICNNQHGFDHRSPVRDGCDWQR